jgi:sugar phosphate isomerase/epimerase
MGRKTYRIAFSATKGKDESMENKNSLESNVRIGTGLAAWGGFRDRFANYREATPVLEAIRQAAAIPSVEGIDVSRGYMPEDIRPVKKALQDANLVVSGVGTALSKGARMQRGTFSSEDPETRRMAIEIVKECMDIAAELGCDKVLLWFGQDGYDYHFELDYLSRWERLVEGTRECARHRKDIKICIEYKVREPKIHQIMNSAATTLLFIDEVAEENVGILFDVGHALIAGEMLAETAALIARRGKLWHVHLNDNYFYADSDLIPGTVHTMGILELLFWLKKLEYKGFVCYDTVALTHDPQRVIAECVHYTRALIEAADRMDIDAMEKAYKCGDAPGGLALARKALFRYQSA